MGIFIGNNNQGTYLSINLVSGNSAILSGSSTSGSTGTILDCFNVSSFYNPAITGTQYQINLTSLQNVLYGDSQLILFESSNTGIGQVDNNGFVSYIGTGNFYVDVILSGNSYYPVTRKRVNVTNRSGTAAAITTTTLIPQQVTASGNILVVYNQNSTRSSGLKDYYTGNRPHFTGVNVLALDCQSGEFISKDLIFPNLINPIINYITGNSKPIRYVVMMLDIPTRITGFTPNSYWPYGAPKGVPDAIVTAIRDLGVRQGIIYDDKVYKNFSVGNYSGTTALVSYINMGDFDTCKVYINRLRDFHSLYSNTSIEISASSGGYTNTGYYFEEHNSSIASTYGLYLCSGYKNAVLAANTGAKIDYRAVGTSFVTTGRDISAYCTWGYNGGKGGAYANDNSIRWGANSNWYLMYSIESFNGQQSTFQGNFIDWFSSGAFGGTGWEKTPVVAAGHVEEPYIGGLEYKDMFGMWESGYNFAECFWANTIRLGIYPNLNAMPSFLYRTSYNIPIGDPLIKK